MLQSSTNSSVLANMPVIKSRGSSKISLPTSEGLRFEKIDQITHLVAAGNYTYIYLNESKRILVCKTLHEMSEKLGQPFRFVRIHRSSIINLHYLSQYLKGKGGCAVLENGESLAVSAGRKQTLLDAIASNFR